MLNKRQLLGKQGEIEAGKFLVGRGYKIIERNFRCRFGEIDIIAREKNFVVFIEVKTRSNSNYGSAASAVTPRKQQQISRVAQLYLIEKDMTNCDARFDVVEVMRAKHGEFDLNHLINAFDLSG